MNHARPLNDRPAPPGLRLAPPVAATAASAAAEEAGCGWLALYLPALPLQVFERGLQTQLPLAVSERARILACNEAARGLGVRPGLGEGAARALAAGLRILRRRPAAERAALERLAAWAFGFSDWVSLEQGVPRPAAVVLEVRRSLRLFGGAEALYRRVIESAEALGWRVRGVLAPTPTAALVLARAGLHGVIGSHAAVRQALAERSPALLVTDAQARDDLARMGVRTVAALLRLPRAGLAERFGLPLLQRIERLLGERADPRRPFVPPTRFQAELELPAEVAGSDGLLFACRRLLDELGGFLAARQGGIQRLDWSLMHGEGRVSGFRLGTARLERDPARWLELLRERLERLALPEPVRAIRLESEPLVPLPPQDGDLFGDPAAVPNAAAALLDRLRARLGDEALRGLARVADHRPERAWRWTTPALGVGRADEDRQAAAAARPGGLARAERPLWLLPEPLLLEQRARRPWLDGPLALEGGCERIETGWWDGFEIARDYYIATNRRGERLWIFREIDGARRWFLHGYMGLPAC
jgi:protein ImuB